MWVCYWDTTPVREIDLFPLYVGRMLTNGQQMLEERQKRGLHADTKKRNGSLIFQLQICVVTLWGKFGDCPPKKNDSIRHFSKFSHMFMFKPSCGCQLWLLSIGGKGWNSVMLIQSYKVCIGRMLADGWVNSLEFDKGCCSLPIS